MWLYLPNYFLYWTSGEWAIFVAAPLVEADKETDEGNFLLWRLEKGVAEGPNEIPKGLAPFCTCKILYFSSSFMLKYHSRVNNSYLSFPYGICIKIIYFPRPILWIFASSVTGCCPQFSFLEFLMCNNFRFQTFPSSIGKLQSWCHVASLDCFLLFLFLFVGDLKKYCTCHDSM